MMRMWGAEHADQGGDPTASKRHDGIDTGARGAFVVMDAMRCVLAVTVAFAHAWYLLIADYSGQASTIATVSYFLAGFAHASVILFFVLSGYWIAKSVDRRMTADWAWKGYAIDRLARLLVVLLPALAIGGALDAIGLYGLVSSTHTGATDTYVLNNNLGERLGWQTLLGNILFLQSIAVAPFGTNGPLWSLAYEFWFYIWFPALWISWRRRRPSPLLATMLLAWIVPHMLIGFACWLCGAALFRATRRFGDENLPPLRRLWLIVASAPFLGTLIYTRLFGLDGVELPLAFTFAVLLYVLLRVELRAPRWLRPFAGYGTQASFSLYVLHFPIIAFAAALLLDDQRLPATGASIALVVAVLAVAILLSALFARYTERNTGRVRLFFSGGRPAGI
jgi:peptidoglycan/LPS O-acetylase OafA/YrhL